MKTIPHNKPTIGLEEAYAVTKVLESGWIIAGDEVSIFEQAIKQYVGAKYAVAVNSGHAALHLSLLTLGVEKGDEVIVPSYSPGDLLNTIYYIGAIPKLVDSEKNGFLMDTEKIHHAVTQKTKAIIVPHIFGFPVDIQNIKKYKIPIIEDCAQALGSMYQSKPVGTFGDISIFSFYASKMITTGQGGMVVTNEEQHYLDIKDRIDYNGRDNYRVRYNYPMTDIAAAIGNVQIGKLGEFMRNRKTIAMHYRGVLHTKKIQYWPRDNDEDVNHFRFILQFANTSERDAVQEHFTKKGITTIVPYSEKEILHNALHEDKKSFPNAETIALTTLSLPIFPTLSQDGIQSIVRAIEEIE